MGGSLNKVILIGRLGKDPEIKTTQSGTSVTNISLATTRQKGDQKTTDWHRLVAFGKTAELCQKYLRKGDETCFEGMLVTRTYDKNGQTQYITEVWVEKVTFLGSAKQATGTAANTDSASQTPASVEDSDIPF
jgi:single-strand DNA-binding protein